MATAREKNQSNGSEKQKKKVESHKKAQALENDVESASYDELRDKLSKRNQDYLYRLNKQLVEAGVSKNESQKYCDSLLQDIVYNQVKGKTATQVLGPVQSQVDKYLNKKEEKPPTKFWMRAVDSWLIFLSMFGLLYGIIGLTSKPTKDNQSGIVTLILISLMWGIVLTKVNDELKKPKSERASTWKLVSYFIVGMLIMLIVIGLTAIVPKQLNPILPPIGYIIVGALAFGIRYLFRKYYHITESAIGTNIRR